MRSLTVLPTIVFVSNDYDSRQLLSMILCGAWVLHGVGECNTWQLGWTALMHAASKGRADCVRLLIDAGADKEAKDNVRVSVVSAIFACTFLVMVETFALNIV